MADNTILNPGASGDTIATNDIAGVKYQIVKLAWGAAGSANQASASSPVPVSVDTQSKVTYTAVLARLATGALTANTLKAVMSFEHAAGSAKTMRMRSLKVSGFATTAVAGTAEFQILRGTAASTGGTVVTAASALPGSAAADTVVKSLPTIVAATVLWAGNATAVPATANSSIGTATELLYDPALDGGQDFTLRAANLDTLVLNIISTAAINVTLNVTAVFTEE